MSKKMKRMALTDSENVATPYKKTVPACESCKFLVEGLKTLQETVENLKKEFNSTVSIQNDAVMSALAQQKIILEKLVRQDNVLTSVKQYFPIKTTEDLNTIESKIFPENTHLFITTMRTVLNHSVMKNLRYLLTTEIIMTYNIDGTHGKKGLKEFSKFYSALLESITSITSCDEPEVQLRKAMQLHKKREFQKRSSDKAAQSTSQTSQ
ncbi:uncharacterized protein LOC118748454 [Rhagoletis pomonella]|uniref:uncharacterized protein LOC118748454 n=1 Tax=Rhagoletis pomonella TaxID=28610 RepID=UPI0017823E52|nr:uncharacterized protein LOC118748454 [Rhagoletis pomonella]